MKRKVIFAVVFGALVAALALPGVFSTPVIGLRTYSEWTDAWQAGQISPVTAWDNSFEAHYPGMSSQFRVPELMVMENIPQEPTTPGLVMAWGDPQDNGEEIIAAWQYEFTEDPDLTDYVIHLCVFPPCSLINTISFGLKDISGNIKSWDWSVWPNGVVPCDTQVCFDVTPKLGAGQAGATSFYMDAGFDLTQVMWMIFDENGIWVDSLPADPAGFGNHAWNYWKEIWIEGPVSTEESSWGRIKNMYKGGSD